MKRAATKREYRIVRHARIRARIKGTSEHPRLSVFRSNVHIGAQLIDDIAGKTLVSASDHELGKRKKGEGRIAQAGHVGELLAKKAAEKKISSAVFDRAGYRYHGMVRFLAEGARKGGLKI